MTLKKKAMESLRQLQKTLQTSAGKQLYSDLHRYIVSLRQDKAKANETIERMQQVIDQAESKHTVAASELESVRKEKELLQNQIATECAKYRSLSREFQNFRDKYETKPDSLQLPANQLGDLMKRLLETCPVSPEPALRVDDDSLIGDSLLCFNLNHLIDYKDSILSSDIERIGLFTTVMCLSLSNVGFVVQRNEEEARARLEDSVLQDFIVWGCGKWFQREKRLGTVVPHVRHDIADMKDF